MATGIVSKLVLVLIVSATSLAAVLFFNQERLIFHPERLPADHAFDFPVPFEEVFLTSGSVRIHSLLFTRPDPKGVILYFHGNAGSLRSWGGLHTDFDTLPYDLWIVDYRGFGKSEGSVSGEASLYADARALLTAAKARYPGLPMVFYGRSIGTGVASRLALEHEPRMLILETPYVSFPDLVEQIAPWAPTPLLRYRLENDAHIRDVRFPVHLFHGDRDELIPVSSTVRLAQLGDHIQSHIITGAQHNTVPAFAEYHRILGQLLGLP